MNSLLLPIDVAQLYADASCMVDEELVDAVIEALDDPIEMTLAQFLEAGCEITR